MDPVNPLDVITGASGTGITPNSGSVTTTSANDLLVAGSYVGAHVTAAGAGFTQRLLTAPSYCLLEDRIVSSTGTYGSTATQDYSSWWIQTLIAFRAAPTDTVPPSQPASFAAVSASATQINLSWAPSTDNVAVTTYALERCTGVGCSTFSPLSSPAITSFSDTGLSPSTSYSYRVRAKDAAGNASAFSAVATAVTQAGTDTQAPTAPSGLSASTASSSQINLVWTGATDNVGIANYLVERCKDVGCSNFAQVGTTATTTYSDAGLQAAATYSYRIRAKDAANNVGPYSNSASATTSAGAIAYVQGAYSVPDYEPSVSTTYLAAQTASNLNVVIVGWYDATSTVVSVTDTKGNVYVSAGTPVKRAGVATQAIYYAKNIVGAAAGTNAVTVTFSGSVHYPDIRIAEYAGIDPVSPLDGYAGASGSSSQPISAYVTTTNANDLLIGGSYVSGHVTAAGTGFNQRLLTDPSFCLLEDTIVNAVGSYVSTAAQNRADWWIQSTVAFKAASVDIQAPTMPSNVTASATSSSQIIVTWSAATDNVGVVGYLVERCSASCGSFSQVGAPIGTSLVDSNLAAATSYTYRISAKDAANNTSPYSAQASAMTFSVADTQPPTQPTTLTVTPGTTQMSLSWTPATDNVGVVGYVIERCRGSGCTDFQVIKTTASTSYLDTGLLAGVVYSYRVRAVDGAGNEGTYSGNGAGVMASCD